MRYLLPTIALMFAICVISIGFTGCSTAQIFSKRADGGSVKLAWDPPAKKETISPGETPPDPSHTNSVGYKILGGRAAGKYTDQIDVGNVLTYKIHGLKADENYCFAVVSYSAAGTQSIPSLEICSIAH